MDDYEELEEKDMDAEELMENDEVSPEEEGFMKGYEEQPEEGDEDEEY